MFEKNGYSIRRCGSCGHGYVSPMPSAADLQALYSGCDDSLYANGVAGQVADFLDADPRRFLSYYTDRLSAITRTAAGPKSRVLDFGCTNGAFVMALTQAGFTRAIGYDVAGVLVDQGRQRWGANLHAGTLDEFLDSQSDDFDVVHAVNVFEHLPDPKGTLGAIQARIHKGGALALTVPNTRSLQVFLTGARSPIVAPPHHLQYFCPQSMAALVQAFGFRVVSVETPFWSTETDNYLQMLGVPRCVAVSLRYAIRVPGAVVTRLGWGGIITIVAVRDR